MWRSSKPISAAAAPRDAIPAWCSRNGRNLQRSRRSAEKKAPCGWARPSENPPTRSRAFCAENGIDAEFRRDGWIWGATCAKHVGSWKGIVDTLAKSGVHPFREVTKNEIAAFCGTTSFLGGIYDPTAATLHPGKLVRGLRRVVLSKGVRIYENSPMTRLERGNPVDVHTAHGKLTAPIGRPHDECLVGVDPRTRIGHSGHRERRRRDRARAGASREARLQGASR